MFKKYVTISVTILTYFYHNIFCNSLIFMKSPTPLQCAQQLPTAIKLSVSVSQKKIAKCDMQSALGFNNDATGSLTKQQAVTQNNSHTLPKLYIKN